jgi:hypothetical protein
MKIKRLYDTPEGWEPERDAMGQVTNPPPLKGIALQHTGIREGQNFSRRFVDAGLAEGWLSMARGKLTLHTQEEDLVYSILHMPGTYCSYCDMKLDDDPSGVSNRAHVEDRHAGEPVADPANPAGYRVTNAYECVLDEEQHARWNGPAAEEARQARYAHAAITAKAGTGATNGASNGASDPEAAQRQRAASNAGESEVSS